MPVLLVHAPGASSDDYVSVAQHLATHADVYAPDLPGHGGSDAPPNAFGVQGFAQWLDKWMHVMEIRRASIVTHARGCQIGVELAACDEDLVDRLVLVAPPDERGARALPARLLGSLRGRALRTSARAIEDRLPQVRAPVLFVRGEWDARASQAWIDWLADRTRDSRIAVIAGARHDVQDSAPDQLARAMLPFLREGRIAQH
ncbi:MAG TPA: alpha/beta fold hydrolase [Steroidobacteraceae bacterium]|nr:alpha/beta fold hydrolase [Steroidobacteraceae bacterium]